jgi:hypothetical protein
MNNIIIPAFLIVGVARCGTTSLFHYLDQHPQIGFPKVKEPKFFSSQVISFPQNGIGDSTVDEKMITDWASYQMLFEGMDHLLTGEASSDYFYYHQQIIPLIKKTVGDIPIIISIRNPFDRAFSAYNNLIRDGRETLSFYEALLAENERISQGWDWMWHYTKGSLYSEGIKNFQANFSKVKVVLFDELDDPKSVLNELTDFLGLNRFEEFNTVTKYSPSGRPKNFLIKLLASRNIGMINYLRKSALELIPRQYLEKVSSGFFKKDELPTDVIKMLNSSFESDILETEKILKRDLTHWKFSA